MRALKPVLAVLCLFALACSGEFFKSCTSTVVGKTVETTKEVTSGVAEGIEEGRKSGSSIDGAILVSTLDELNTHGGVQVVAIEGTGASSCRVVLGVENREATPLRLTGLQVRALDKQGFAVEPMGGAIGEVTVPPRAKEKVTIELGIAAEQVGSVRAWEVDLPLVPPTPAPAEAPPG